MGETGEDRAQSKGRNRGGARAGLLARAAAHVYWPGNFLRARSQTVGRKSPRLHESFSRFAGGDQFHCDVLGAVAERISRDERRHALAIWADSLPDGAFYSGQSAARHGPGPLLQL